MKRTRSDHRSRINPILASALGCCLVWLSGTVDVAQTPDELRLLFHRAVDAQQSAREMTDDSQKQIRLEEAADLYTSYLQSKPDSGAAANNLAKVYAQLDKNDEAKQYFERAIAANDPNQGLYLQNYAEFLEKSGDWKAASSVYVRFAKEQPLSRSRQESLAERYATRGLDELAGYLWTLAEGGSSWQMGEIALQALADSRNDHDDARTELLTIVSIALSRMHYDPTLFAETEAAKSLSDLASDAAIGDGAGQLVQLHSAVEGLPRLDTNGRPVAGVSPENQGRNLLKPERYFWWSDGRPDKDPVRGVWRADGFHALARSLASRIRQTASEYSKRAGRAGQRRAAERYRSIADLHYDVAERMYRLAADLTPWEVDPEAVRQLVRLQLEKDDLPAVEQVLGQYERRLYEGKGDAYRTSQLKKIFTYHRTLGELYTQLSQWGDSSKVRSAVFQLEHAREKSRQIEAESGGEPPVAYRFTPDMVDMLGRAYDEQGRSNETDRLRVEEAEHYRELGDEGAAQRVLKPIREKSLSDPVLKNRRDRLIESTPAHVGPMATTELRRVPPGEVRLLPTDGRSSQSLSTEAVAQIQAQLQRILDSGAPLVEIVDPRRPSPEWSGAPGILKSLNMTEDGKGTLTLELDGRSVVIPFEKITEETEAPLRVPSVRRVDHD